MAKGSIRKTDVSNRMDVPKVEDLSISLYAFLTTSSGMSSILIEAFSLFLEVPTKFEATWEVCPKQNP